MKSQHGGGGGTPIVTAGTASTCVSHPAHRPSRGQPPEARVPRVFLRPELKKRPTARVAALMKPHPLKPPPRPTSGSHCLLHALSQAGEQYGPPPHLRALCARCPFSTNLRPFSLARQHAGRTTPSFHVSASDPAVVFQHAPALDRAVGRAYVVYIACVCEAVASWPVNSTKSSAARDTRCKPVACASTRYSKNSDRAAGLW
jgi:hypothetical protein